MRKLLLFKSARDARAVFSVREIGEGKVYHTQLRHDLPNGDVIQYGFGTDLRELHGKFAGQRWDEISWRWDAPESLRTAVYAHLLVDVSGSAEARVG